MSALNASIPEFDRELLRIGRHRHAFWWLGAHAHVSGATRFAVWAPHAEAVHVCGDFNSWNPRAHPLRCSGDDGLWTGTVEGAQPGMRYKYAISRAGRGDVLKSDPYASEFELRPATASVISEPSRHEWRDDEWLARRAQIDWRREPLSIYEVHLGSWQRDEHGSFLDYRTLAQRLVAYAVALSYTHIELLPVTEHPFDGSWGYQSVGYFAPTRRFGSPDDLRWFVDHCHQHGLGVILDWCPAHFPGDAYALAEFDGQALYEHPDPRRGQQPDWGTLVFDYGRPQVCNLLLASAIWWLQEFHFDGLRVDAVASMLYLDYSRRPGEWLPNEYGGHQHLEAMNFLRDLNDAVLDEVPGALMIAEESTSWPGVSQPTSQGGLGFTMKWNLGWMHDTLSYLQIDPMFRRSHHQKLSFGALYAHSERFVLPFSHDEVVHGKGSLFRKPWGDEHQRFAQLRLLHAYQTCWPGKKLMFMGGEFGQAREWNHDTALDWPLLNDPRHAGVQCLVRDLNHTYRAIPALHLRDFDADGFAWLDADDTRRSVLSFLRRSADDLVVVVLNFSPERFERYRIGVPLPGRFREIVNTDSRHYGGDDFGNDGLVRSEARPCHGQRHSVSLRLAPFSAVLLRPALFGGTSLDHVE
jgi:1,4-alpha-glucan branching enzyme